MNHVSERVIVEYIDRRLSAGLRRDVEEHCAACAQCRRTLEFHQAVKRRAAEPIQGLLPDDFTERIMRRAHVRTPRFSWLLQNSSNIIALIVVLGILAAVGYLSGSSSFASGGTGEEPSYMQMVTIWKEASASMVSELSRHTTQTIIPVIPETDPVFGNVFWMGAAALLVLGLADRLRHRAKITLLS